MLHILHFSNIYYIMNMAKNHFTTQIPNQFYNAYNSNISILCSNLCCYFRKELTFRDKIYEKIAEYSQLKQTIGCLLKTDLSDGIRTQMDLGSNFYAQTHVLVLC